MNFKENYLYFAESTVKTGNDQVGGGFDGARRGGGGGIPGCDPEAALLPVRSFLGFDIGSDAIVLKFKSGNSLANNTVVTLSCNIANVRKVIQACTKIMNSYPHATGFIVVADAETIGNTKKAEYHPLFEGLVTGVSITDGHACGS